MFPNEDDFDMWSDNPDVKLPDDNDEDEEVLTSFNDC